MTALNQLQIRQSLRLRIPRLSKLRSPWPIILHLNETPLNQITKIDSNLGQQRRLLVKGIHAFLPNRRSALYTTQLPDKDGIELIQMLLCPFDAGAGHHGREALLVYTDGVFHKGEVDEGDLENVQW